MSNSLVSIPDNIWFLGIGGIGMSALARWFRASGYRVGGYDKTPTPLTEALGQEGIEITFDESVEALPTWVMAEPARTLVVRTPAVPIGHAQWEYFKANDYAISKRSEVLGLLTRGQHLIAVAGTHGKTTTSSMVAHLLHSAGVPVAAFLGGISVNLGSNLLLPVGSGEPEAGSEQVTQSHSHSVTQWTVVEADEYDRSFLTLFPTIAVVTSTDADHLDIYGDKNALVDSFRDFISQIQPGGLLLLNHTADERVLTKIDPTVTVIRYGLENSFGAEQSLNRAIAQSRNLTVQGRSFIFDLASPFGAVPHLNLRVPGFHNVENMVAAATVARHVGVEEERLREAVASYAGVKRRFEFIHEDDRRVYVDDYAHHPREIEAFLTSLRALYPGRRLTAVFQPHLFSRTRDFAAGFARALSLADEVILLPIYPARELPIPGVTSEMLLADITAPEKHLIDKSEALAFLQNKSDLQVLATVGAGDIDTLVEPLRQWLQRGV